MEGCGYGTSMKITKLKNKLSPLIIVSFATWFVGVLVFTGIIFYAIKIQNETSQVISTPYIIAIAAAVFVGIASFGVGLIAITYKVKNKSIKSKSWIWAGIKIVFLLVILPAFLLWEIVQPAIVFIRIKSFGLKQYWEEFRFKAFVLKAGAFLLVAFVILPMWVGGYAIAFSFFHGNLKYGPGQKNTSNSTVLEAKLPPAEGEKAITFNWKYKGKKYTLDETLYDSYYKFYRSMPTVAPDSNGFAGSLSDRSNELVLRTAQGDETIKKLTDSIRTFGQQNKLSDDQIAELALSFVQTIPYDTDKFNNRKAGLNGIEEKITYPYEVLYENKGVCQDKSYLAYDILKELGYGVALFSFKDENHMALGVKCPTEYSSYESGYCFAETTTLGNKIGSISEIAPKKGIAVSDQEISHFGNDNSEDYAPLTNIVIANQIDGKSYAGVIATSATQKEINGLQNTLYTQKNELKKLKANLDDELDKVNSMKKKLDSLFKKEKYDDYLDYYKKYTGPYDDYEKDRKAYNKKVDAYNRVSDKYNALVRSLYQ